MNKNKKVRNEASKLKQKLKNQHENKEIKNVADKNEEWYQRYNIEAKWVLFLSAAQSPQVLPATHNIYFLKRIILNTLGNAIRIIDTQNCCVYICGVI